MEQYDVVVVGGGIAGSALAARLASNGVRVLVLERQTVFRDKVRGEFMHVWGAAEMLQLGLEDVLLEAGGGYCTTLVGYNEGQDPAVAEASAVPLAMLVPDVAGAMCVGHPQASEALNSHAARCGADVRRGVGDVEVEAGPTPSVRYELDGEIHEVTCRLLIGADGRQSTVRKGLRIGIEQVESKAALGGMLVRAPDWPSDVSMTGTEGDRHFLAFPRPNGFVRLYVARIPGPTTAGANRAQHMLDDFRLTCVPGSERLASAEPVGPCSYYIGIDSWTDGPVVDGAVLIGDAAGWSDPILGEGLSVAMRDARAVSDVLLAGDDWSPAAFDSYVEERAERMRRLKIIGHIVTEIRCTFTPEGRDRRVRFGELLATDPLVLGIMIGALAGPEQSPAEAFDDANVDKILAFA